MGGTRPKGKGCRKLKRVNLIARAATEDLVVKRMSADGNCGFRCSLAFCAAVVGELYSNFSNNGIAELRRTVANLMFDNADLVVASDQVPEVTNKAALERHACELTSMNEYCEASGWFMLANLLQVVIEIWNSQSDCGDRIFSPVPHFKCPPRHFQLPDHLPRMVVGYYDRRKSNDAHYNLFLPKEFANPVRTRKQETVMAITKVHLRGREQAQSHNREQRRTKRGTRDSTIECNAVSKKAKVSKGGKGTEQRQGSNENLCEVESREEEEHVAVASLRQVLNPLSPFKYARNVSILSMLLMYAAIVCCHRH